MKDDARKRRILVINTGSTSTKIAVFDGSDKLFEENIEHTAEDLSGCTTLNDQYPIRRDAVKNTLEEHGFGDAKFDAVAARGGTFGIAEGGAYKVEDNLLEACRNPVTNHPSNLSAIIAHDFAEESCCDAYIYDAVCVNEVRDIARYTGLADVKRRPFSHVLNTRATARDAAAECGKKYEDMTFIVAHLGGGISINLHRKGRIIDLCSDDEGPMSPERAGKLNGKSYVDMCYSGKYTKQEMMRRIKGRGGLISHLGTSSMIDVEKMIADGDEHAREVVAAMAYQISKEIGALATVVHGDVDMIILTGGCAYSKTLTDLITPSVSFIAPVKVVPGSKEMEALAEGVNRVMDGEESYHIYRKTEGRK
jgi:butyrate kinase